MNSLQETIKCDPFSPLDGLPADATFTELKKACKSSRSVPLKQDSRFCNDAKTWRLVRQRELIIDFLLDPDVRKEWGLQDSNSIRSSATED